MLSLNFKMTTLHLNVAVKSVALTQTYLSAIDFNIGNVGPVDFIDYNFNCFHE